MKERTSTSGCQTYKYLCDRPAVRIEYTRKLLRVHHGTDLGGTHGDDPVHKRKWHHLVKLSVEAVGKNGLPYREEYCTAC